MTASTHGQRKASVPSKAHRSYHVAYALHGHDDGWIAVVNAIPDPPTDVIVRVVCRDNLTADAIFEFLQLMSFYCIQGKLHPITPVLIAKMAPTATQFDFEMLQKPAWLVIRRSKAPYDSSACDHSDLSVKRPRSPYLALRPSPQEFLSRMSYSRPESGKCYVACYSMSMESEKTYLET